MMTEKKSRTFPFLLIAIILLSAALFLLCYGLDNKYTHVRPQSSSGITHLDMDWYDTHPLFYLADGWSFYQDQLLTPDEISAATPDAYFYIGRYGGFDLGDPDADPHGQSTYRTVIVTDAQERDFALELTPIYSQWRL